MNNNQNSENKTMVEFLSQKFKTNDPKEIQKHLNSLDEQKQKELAAEYKQWKADREKQKMKKVAHGAKLNYVKSLKHICPEGYELYYYKVGGSINCGCKGKKFEKGDKVEKAETGIVAKFKKEKKNTVVNGSTKQPMLNAMKKADDQRKEQQRRDRISEEQYYNGTYGNSDNPPDSKAMSKEFVKKYEQKNKRYIPQAQTMSMKKGSTVDKFKKARCGSKMKKK